MTQPIDSNPIPITVGFNQDPLALLGIARIVYPIAEAIDWRQVEFETAVDSNTGELLEISVVPKLEKPTRLGDIYRKGSK